MQGMLSFLLVALTATFTMAAPMPNQTPAKRSFRLPVSGRNLLSPTEEVARVSRKYDWAIVFDPNEPLEIIGQQSSSASAGSLIQTTLTFEIPLPTESVVPVGSSSAAGSSVQASTTTATSKSETTLVRQSSTTTSAGADTTSTESSGSGKEEGEVSASPEPDDKEYLASVTIGGQKLTLDFDTGSSDLWVFSTEMPADESRGHTLFDPAKSSTWSDYPGATWQTHYGDDSSASGTVGFDAVTVGGVTATKQAVELATQAAAQFVRDSRNDGLVGLAFSKLNQVSPQKQKTFFENVMPDLEQPVFTANLETDASGEYEFGAIDASKYTGEIHYTPVNTTQGYWQISSPAYSVDGAAKQACTTCSPAIADTGTSLMIVDYEVAKAFYDKVHGARISVLQSGFVYPCDAKLPDLAVEIGGFMATLKGSELTYLQVGDNQCYGSVQPNTVTIGVPLQVYGDAFLKQLFAVFDGGNVQFGVAQKP